MIQPRISALPSLFLVCDSNTGFLSLIAMAPAMPFAHVDAVVILLEELVDALEESFAESAQMRAPVAGILTVNE